MIFLISIEQDGVHQNLFQDVFIWIYIIKENVAASEKFEFWCK